MTQEQINYFRAAASLGLIPDEENPLFIFSLTNAGLLLDIANGKMDMVQLARMEMRNRGLDVKTGKWVGWNKPSTYEEA
jgi:hypothetical protein